MLTGMFRDDWRKRFHENDYQSLMNAELPRNTVTDATSDLVFALRVLYSNEDSQLADRLLRRGAQAISSAERLMTIHWADDFVPEEPVDDDSPDEWCELQVRAEFFRTRTYLLALLGSPFRQEDLLRASRDLAQWSLCLEPWEGGAEADYLSAVRAALIADNSDRAQHLLQLTRPFSYHREEHALLKVLSTERATSLPLESGVVLDFFDRYFDRIRDPKFQPQAILGMDREIVRFEIGILRYKYFMGWKGWYDWKAIVETISQ